MTEWCYELTSHALLYRYHAIALNLDFCIYKPSNNCRHFSSSVCSLYPFPTAHRCTMFTRSISFTRD